MAIIQSGTTVCVEVYMPDTDRHGLSLGADSHAYWLNRIEEVCADGLGDGGCSTYWVKGRWHDTREITAVVRTYVRTDAVDGRAAARRLVEQHVEPVLQGFKLWCSQEAVALTIDGQWYTVQPDQPDVAVDPQGAA